MPKKIKQKQKVSQKVIQNVIVKVGEIKKKKARRRAKRAMKEAEGISTFRQGTTIPPMVTYQTAPTQFTPYIPKEFEEAYRIAKDMYAKKEVEPAGFMDLRPVAEPLKVKAKEVLEEKEIVTPVPKPKKDEFLPYEEAYPSVVPVKKNIQIKKFDVSNPSPDVIFSDNIQDKPLDYKPIASLNVFPQQKKEEFLQYEEAYPSEIPIKKNIIPKPKKEESIEEEEIFEFQPAEKKSKSKKKRDKQKRKIEEENLLLRQKTLEGGLVPLQEANIPVTKAKKWFKKDYIAEIEKITGKPPPKFTKYASVPQIEKYYENLLNQQQPQQV